MRISAAVRTAAALPEAVRWAAGRLALVAGVQALRLEFYELFSRVFKGQGRPFRPWGAALAMSAASTAPTRRGARTFANAHGTASVSSSAKSVRSVSR